MIRNQLAMLAIIYPLVYPGSNKRNRTFYDYSASWALLSLHFVAKGKSDAKFSLDHFLHLCTFSRNIVGG